MLYIEGNMIDILSNKNLTTRFQIMVEIASSQPNIQQKEIAGKLGITPQAVSDYVQQLTRDKLVISEGRSRLKVSPLGIDWMIRQLNDAKEYFGSVERIIWNIRITPALAETKIAKGQKISLKMKDGLLYAGREQDKSASGTAVTEAEQDEVVGIADIRGIIEMEEGEVTIIEVPGVQKGTLKAESLDILKNSLDNKNPVAYLGIEALAILNKLQVHPSIIFAGGEAMIDAVRKGISPFIVCVDEEIPVLVKRLEDARVKYKFIRVIRSE
jgi:putative transcriptional regulator